MTGRATQSGIRWATSSSYQLIRNGHARGRREGEWVIDCSRDKLPKSGSGNGGWDEGLSEKNFPFYDVFFSEESSSSRQK